jgi:hypothetical protein
MIDFNCLEEIIMPTLLLRIERRARFLMGALAFLTVLVLLLLKTQLIQLQPSFDAYGWYAVDTDNPAVILTRRADSESACRARASTQRISCQQGKSLNLQLLASRDVH